MDTRTGPSSRGTVIGHDMQRLTCDMAAIMVSAFSLHMRSVLRAICWPSRQIETKSYKPRDRDKKQNIKYKI